MLPCRIAWRQRQRAPTAASSSSCRRVPTHRLLSAPRPSVPLLRAPLPTSSRPWRFYATSGGHTKPEPGSSKKLPADGGEDTTQKGPAASSNDAKSPNEQLKELEDLLMDYMKTAAKPLPGRKADGKGKKNQYEEFDEEMLDAATEQLLKRKEEEFKQVRFWDSFMAPELRHNFIFILLLAFIIGLSLKIIRLKGDLLDEKRKFEAERFELAAAAERASVPATQADLEAQVDDILVKVQVITGLEDAKDLRLLREQVTSVLRFSRAAATPTPGAAATVAATAPAPPR